jgi:Fe2+ or Zn2+ uptake regulation protein
MVGRWNEAGEVIAVILGSGVRRGLTADRLLQQMFFCTSCKLARDPRTFSVVRTPAELTTAFREQGLKMTPQRQLLFRLLHENETHPTAESLFEVASEQMPGISLRTVYQTLNDLAAMGELRVVSHAPGAVRFDPNTADHHHAQCVRCGHLRDVYVDDMPYLPARGLEGFTPQATSIVFSGMCDACAAGETPSKQ